MSLASRTLPAIAFSALVACGEAEGLLSEAPRRPASTEVELGFNACPEFEYVIVVPREIPVGAPAEVIAQASDPENGRIKYRWRASSGAFAHRSRASTSYECDEPGPQTLTVRATDPEECSSSRQLEVSCLEE